MSWCRYATPVFCKGERNGDFSPQNCEKKVYEFYEQMHYYSFNGIGMLNERNLVMCDGELWGVVEGMGDLEGEHLGWGPPGYVTAHLSSELQFLHLGKGIIVLVHNGVLGIR